MSSMRLKEQIYQYLMQKADKEGRVEFTYDELAAKFGEKREKLYMLIHALSNERRLNLVSRSKGALRCYKVNRSRQEENMCEVNITLTGEALKTVLVKELESTARKFIFCKDSGRKMQMAEEFAKLLAAGKNQQALTTTARLPLSMLRDKILDQIPIQSAAPAPQEHEEDDILGVA